jgi:hypothetical protein
MGIYGYKCCLSGIEKSVNGISSRASSRFVVWLENCSHINGKKYQTCMSPTYCH